MHSDEELGERIAVLEYQVLSIKEELMSDVQELKNLVKSNVDEVHKLNRQLTRYQGFVGGVVLVLTSIVTVLGFLKDYLVQLFSK